MATQPPDSFLNSIFDKLGNALQPPPWMVEELQRRAVVLVNHVLMQEPEAQARLKRQVGRVVEAQWMAFSARVRATPAGLLELAPAGVQPDLTLAVGEVSPLALAQAALRGEKPPIRIAGDVQLAAEVQWLVDHVRWDVEEDLARVLGDAPAHAVAQGARRFAEGLRNFVGRAADAGASASPGATTSSAAAPGSVGPGAMASGFAAPGGVGAGAAAPAPGATGTAASAGSAPPWTSPVPPGAPGGPWQGGA